MHSSITAPTPLTATGTAVATADSVADATVVERWLSIQRWVRQAVDSATPAAAAEVLRNGLVDLAAVPDAPGQARQHLVAQLAVLTDLARLLAAPGVPAQVTGTAALEPSSPLAGAGDVLCLLRIGDGDLPAPAAGDMPGLVGRVRAAVRAEDQVVPIDDRHLVVVMRNVPVPIAWRRMNGLVGARPSAVPGSSHVVRAGIAPVGASGTSAALEAARTALARCIEGSGGWVGVAARAVPTTATSLSMPGERAHGPGEES